MFIKIRVGLNTGQLYQPRRRGRCFKCFDGDFFDAVPVASAFPDRLSRKYAGSDPAHDRCIVHS